MREIPSAVRKQIILGTEFPDAVEAMVMRCQTAAEISWLNNSIWAALDALPCKTQFELSVKQSLRVEEFSNAESSDEVGPSQGHVEEQQAAEASCPPPRIDVARDDGPAETLPA